MFTCPLDKTGLVQNVAANLFHLNVLTGQLLGLDPNKSQQKGKSSILYVNQIKDYPFENDGLSVQIPGSSPGPCIYIPNVGSSTLYLFCLNFWR